MKILTRFIGSIFLLLSIVVGFKLTYDLTIFKFWSTPWLVGTFSIIILFGCGIGLLFIEKEHDAYLALNIFGHIYLVVSVLIYCFWSGLHISGQSLTFSEYFGFMVLFAIVLIISAFGIICTVQNNKNISKNLFVLPAWAFAISNLFTICLILNKYVFLQKKFIFFPFVGDLLILIISAVLFVASYMAYTEGI